MLLLYLLLLGKVNIYTMDHCGTGEGTRLTCQASKSDNLEPSQVPECAQELEERFGDLAAFSTTSAASDLVTFISEYGNDFSTTVYGAGYGAMWVERVMHLDPPEVTGYVLDSIATTSGVSPDRFMNASSMGAVFGEVGDSFFALCTEDKEIKARFKKKGLKATIEHLMTKSDKNPSSACAKLLKTAEVVQDDPPSFTVRYLMGNLLLGLSTRTLIPPIVHRLIRCAQKDVEVLKRFVRAVNTARNSTDASSDRTPPLLDNLIMYSELWEAPTSSVSELKTQFEEPTVNVWTSYCAFTKERSPACNKHKLGDYKNNGIVYERDEYWNKAAKISDQASVLLMSSEMDPISPNQYAEYQLNALDGDKKELVTFKYTAQDNLLDSSVQMLCGMQLLASFVKGEGDLDKLNRTCIEKDMSSSLNWTIPISYQYAYLSTDDAYDGEYDPSLSAQESGASSVESASQAFDKSSESSSTGISDSIRDELMGLLEGGSTSTS